MIVVLVIGVGALGIRASLLLAGAGFVVRGRVLERVDAVAGRIDDGLAKALRGETTIEEVLRVTRMG